jgi:hypothetical protein
MNRQLKVNGDKERCERISRFFAAFVFAEHTHQDSKDQKNNGRIQVEFGSQH